jgi:hypothetical protein
MRPSSCPTRVERKRRIPRAPTATRLASNATIFVPQLHLSAYQPYLFHITSSDRSMEFAIEQAQIDATWVEPQSESSPARDEHVSGASSPLSAALSDAVTSHMRYIERSPSDDNDAVSSSSTAAQPASHTEQDIDDDCEATKRVDVSCVDCGSATSSRRESEWQIDERIQEVINRFTKVDVQPEVLTSRRGTVVGYGGGVASRKLAFLKSASGSTKSLEESLQSVRQPPLCVHS